MLEIGQRKIRIPVSSRLHPVDREQAQMISRFVVTPEDARKLIRAQQNQSQKLDLSPEFTKQPWGLRQLDGLERIYTLTYKGCEMRLIFKRQVLDEVIDAGIPVPAAAIEDQRQEWLSINLVDDAERAVEERESQEEISGLKKENQQLTQELHDVRIRMMKNSADLSDEVIKWKLLAEKAVLEVEKERKEKTQLVEDQKRAVRNGKRQSELDQLELLRKMVKSLTPTLNILQMRSADTDWARISWDGTVTALRGLGLEVIQPQTGEEFNPNLHNAIETLELPEPDVDGKVFECHCIGFRKDKITLRPADVVVSVHRPVEEGGQE